MLLAPVEKERALELYLGIRENTLVMVGLASVIQKKASKKYQLQKIQNQVKKKKEQKLNVELVEYTVTHGIRENILERGQKNKNQIYFQNSMLRKRKIIHLIILSRKIFTITNQLKNMVQKMLSVSIVLIQDTHLLVIFILSHQIFLQN